MSMRSLLYDKVLHVWESYKQFKSPIDNENGSFINTETLSIDLIMAKSYVLRLTLFENNLFNDLLIAKKVKLKLKNLRIN
jgi:hypothetical protein